MKRKTSLVYAMTIIIAGLLITSAAGIPTMRQTQPAIEKEEKNDDVYVPYPEDVTALLERYNFDLATRKSVPTKNINMQAEKVPLERQTKLVEMSSEETVELKQFQRPEQLRQPYIITLGHPGLAGNKYNGNLFLMYELYALNISDPPAFDNMVWTYSNDYGETWGPEWFWDTEFVGDHYTYPSVDFWGDSVIEGTDEFFGTFVDVTEPYWDPDDSTWYNGTNVSIMKILHNDSDPLNASVGLRTWTGFGDTHWDMIMADIASSDGLYFPPEGEPPQDPWGLCAYVMSNNYAPGQPGYPVLEGPHMFYPVEYDPGSGSSTNYGLLSWYVNNPSANSYINNCESSCAYIDDVTKSGYAAWDPEYRAGVQRGLMLSWEYNMIDSFDYVPGADTGYGVIWYMNSTDIEIEHPVIAANDGSVVVAMTMYNDTVPGEKWISMWYNELHNGDIENVTISGIWSIPDKEVLFPEISHVYDDIFMLEFIIDNELFATFSWDGGQTWAYNQSEGWLEYYSWSGDDVVISDYRSHDLSDDAHMTVWEYDASEGGDTLTYLHYTYNTVQVTGDCIDEFANPVNPDFVRIFNYELDPITWLDPPYTDNTYDQTMLLGFDLWTNLTLRFVATSGNILGSEFHNFSTIDHINVVDIIMDGIVADVDENCVVNVVDFLALLAQWGSYGPGGDIDFNGVVNVVDFLALLAHWGDTC